MIFTKTKLEGVYVLTPRVFTDTRGYFFESYSKREFEQNGLHYDFVQDNQSFSSYGTIRGPVSYTHLSLPAFSRNSASGLRHRRLICASL